MQQVRGTFLQYSQTLEKIAHLMMPDLQRLLDHESHVRARRGARLFSDRIEQNQPSHPS